MNDTYLVALMAIVVLTTISTGLFNKSWGLATTISTVATVYAVSLLV